MYEYNQSVNEFNRLAPIVGFFICLIFLYVVIRIAISMSTGSSRGTRTARDLEEYERKVDEADRLHQLTSAGHFKVSGVDRSTKMDTTWYCDAESAENARAKGELEGIVVTRVEQQ